MTARDHAIYVLIAGEASGDLLGAKLMAALRAASPRPIAFYGVGGERMQAEGLQSFFPMHELSLMGFIEILPHVPHLLKRITETANRITDLAPDAVITIDAPEFNFRLIKKIQPLRTEHCHFVHYVAPSVWVYRPGRAAKIAKLYDQLLTLLPFEPPYFEKEGLPSLCVGHPIIEEPITPELRQPFRQEHGLTEQDTLLCLMVGSRVREVNTHGPVFIDTVKILEQHISNLQVVIPTLPGIRPLVTELCKGLTCPVHFASTKEERHRAFAGSDLALAKSGTGTFELALASVPMVVTYKVHPLSAWMMRKMIRVRYVNLMNIIMNQQLIPELLQEKCNAIDLSNALLDLYRHPDMQEKQRRLMKQSLKEIGLGSPISASQKAAQSILTTVESKERCTA